MKRRVSKSRKRGDNKAYQFDRFGNVVDDSIGEGTIAQTFDKKAIDKYMSNKKPVKQNPEDEKKKIAKAYGIKNEVNEAFDDLIKQAKDKSNRTKDAEMVKKMKKVAFSHRKDVDEGMGAAYMPDTADKRTPGREITSKAVLKQLNRNRNRGTMKGKVRTPNVRYLHDRDRETDLTAAERGKTVINPEEPKKGKGHRRKKGRKGKKK